MIRFGTGNLSLSKSRRSGRSLSEDHGFNEKEFGQSNHSTESGVFHEKSIHINRPEEDGLVVSVMSSTNRDFDGSHHTHASSITFLTRLRQHAYLQGCFLNSEYSLGTQLVVAFGGVSVLSIVFIMVAAIITTQYSGNLVSKADWTQQETTSLSASGRWVGTLVRRSMKSSTHSMGVCSSYWKPPRTVSADIRMPTGMRATT